MTYLPLDIVQASLAKVSIQLAPMGGYEIIMRKPGKSSYGWAFRETAEQAIAKAAEFLTGFYAEQDEALQAKVDNDPDVLRGECGVCETIAEPTARSHADDATPTWAPIPDPPDPWTNEP